MIPLFLKFAILEPANTTHLPEKQVSITFPFCSNQHSDHRMLQSFLRIKKKNWFLRINSYISKHLLICESGYLHVTLHIFQMKFLNISISLDLTLLLLLAMAHKQDLLFQLKYLFSICLCSSEVTIIGGRPPSSPSKI